MATMNIPAQWKPHGKGMVLVNPALPRPIVEIVHVDYTFRGKHAAEYHAQMADHVIIGDTLDEVREKVDAEINN